VKDPVTIREAAERIGITPQALHKHAQRDDFPEPFTQIGNARVWEWPDIRDWYNALDGRTRRAPRR
jgi:predicted DNA-binding transcriptional regulator AlpA